MSSPDWKGRHVVVVGAGRSGRAAAGLLVELGAAVTLTDARPTAQLDDLESLEAEGVTLVCGGHPESLWDGAEAVVVSPGIPPSAPPVRTAVERGLETLAEIELAAPFLDGTVVGITGSNGKSTVTSMVGAVLTAGGLRTAVCGNIGVALSTAVRRQLRGDERFDAWSVELSSFQTEAIRDFHADVAVFLNLTPDHLDRHGSMEAYGAAKARLLRNAGSDDWVVVNADDPVLARCLPPTPARRAAFGRRRQPAPAAWIEDGTIRWQTTRGAAVDVVAVADLAVIGPHNESNAAAATVVGGLLEVSPGAIARGLKDYRALPHRMESCGEVGGVRCIDDSKATNVEATLAALGGFRSGVWLILGGRDKGSEFEQLRPWLPGRVERLLLVGEAAERIGEALESTVPMERCGTLETAVETALAGARPGDVLLLSPACTSFDQFANFEARGRRFRELVGARRSPATDNTTRTAGA